MSWLNPNHEGPVGVVAENIPQEASQNEATGYVPWALGRISAGPRLWPGPRANGRHAIPSFCGAACGVFYTATRARPSRERTAVGLRVA